MPNSSAKGLAPVTEAGSSQATNASTVWAVRELRSHGVGSAFISRSTFTDDVSYCVQPDCSGGDIELAVTLDMDWPGGEPPTRPLFYRPCPTRRHWHSIIQK